MSQHSKKTRTIRHYSDQAEYPGITFPDVGRTKQEQKDDCDINLIVARYTKTGRMEHVASNTPVYGNFDNAIQYETALTEINKADEAFQSLPVRLRQRMDYDPHTLLAFMDNPENFDECVQLGLFPEPEPIPPSQPENPRNPTPEPSPPPTETASSEARDQ